MRVLATSRSNKNDPNDALWVAISGSSRAAYSPWCQAADHPVVLPVSNLIVVFLLGGGVRGVRGIDGGRGRVVDHRRVERQRHVSPKLAEVRRRLNVLATGSGLAMPWSGLSVTKPTAAPWKSIGSSLLSVNPGGGGGSWKENQNWMMLFSPASVS